MPPRAPRTPPDGVRELKNGLRELPTDLGEVKNEPPRLKKEPAKIQNDPPHGYVSFSESSLQKLLQEVSCRQLAAHDGRICSLLLSSQPTRDSHLRCPSSRFSGRDPAHSSVLRPLFPDHQLCWGRRSPRVARSRSAAPCAAARAACCKCFIR